jgi:gamma-glutamyl phosphate reductase
MKDTVVDLVLCEASCDEHQMMFKYDNDPDWEMVYISYYLQSDTFWGKIKTAFRHILGHKSRYGDFGEIILSADDETIAKFQRVVDKLKAVQEHEKNKKV